MHSSKSITRAGTLIRSWTARAALLVACIGTVATSPPSHTTTAEFTGPSFTMTAEQTKVTRRVTIRLTPKEDISASVSVDAHVKVRWTPEDASTPTPRFRLHWADAIRDGHDEPPLSAQPLPVGHHAEYSLTPNCTSRQECIYEGDLEFHLDSEAPGTLDITEWNLGVAVYHDTPEELSKQDIFITISDL